MATMDIIKTNLFSAQMPDMPPLLREVWQVAYMLRRKYSNPDFKDPDAYFKAAWSDVEFIAQTYGYDETVASLMAEVYSDIERQYKVVEARRAEAD